MTLCFGVSNSKTIISIAAALTLLLHLPRDTQTVKRSSEWVSAALTHSALHNLLVSGALYYTIWCSSYFEWHLDVIDLMCLNVIRRLYAVARLTRCVFTKRPRQCRSRRSCVLFPMSMLLYRHVCQQRCYFVAVALVELVLSASQSVFHLAHWSAEQMHSSSSVICH